MAGDGSNCSCCLDDSFAKEVQTQLGFLAFPLKQCIVGRLGIARSGLRSDSVATGTGNYEYSRGKEDSRELGPLKSAQPTTENSPALECWVLRHEVFCSPGSGRLKTNPTEIFSRPFHGLDI